MKTDNKHNFFFEAYAIESGDILATVRTRLSEDIMEPFKEYLDFDNIYYNYYGNDIKDKLWSVCPMVINEFNKQLGVNIIDDSEIQVNIIDSLTYRKYNENYDNECKFIEYIQSEKAKIDKETNITSEQLENINCEDITEQKFSETLKEYYGIEDYKDYKYRTVKEDGENFIIVSFSKGMTNNNAIWHIHIDNNACETIGSADISTVWQFNNLMEIFGSKFRI